MFDVVAVIPDERRTRIADAALELLAREGARGLTHRAVDAELQLPNGSTSYYCRTRSALLMAAAERLLELDTADLARVSEDTAGIASLLERWLSPAGRMRSLARMELLLTAARDPELAFMARARENFIDHAVAAHRSNATGPEREAARLTATALIALVDGLTLHGLVTGDLTRSAARRMLERLRHNPPSAARSQAKKPRRDVKRAP
jgi:DNA-binding transcriptional regulator YbjK